MDYRYGEDAEGGVGFGAGEGAEDGVGPGEGGGDIRRAREASAFRRGFGGRQDEIIGVLVIGGGEAFAGVAIFGR